MEEVKVRQERPLAAVYPTLYLDTVYMKIRDAGLVQNPGAIYVGIG